MCNVYCLDIDGWFVVNYLFCKGQVYVVVLVEVCYNIDSYLVVFYVWNWIDQRVVIRFKCEGVIDYIFDSGIGYCWKLFECGFQMVCYVIQIWWQKFVIEVSGCVVNFSGGCLSFIGIQ